MEGIQDKVRSLWVPLRGMNLLLPNVAVAEISSYRVPRVVPDMPEWFAGMVKWREHEIPVVSLELLCGMGVKSNPVFSRLMILNSTRPGSAVSHSAIITAGLPGLIQFDSKTADDVKPYNYEGLQCVIRVGREKAAIPDLEYLQGLLEQHLDRAA